jgi:hypothetical protein
MNIPEVVATAVMTAHFFLHSIEGIASLVSSLFTCQATCMKQSHHILSSESISRT